MAIQSEEAANAKAKARDLLSATPAFIRHALRRAEAEVSLMTLPADRLSSESPENKARESVMCSDDAIDIVNGWLTVSRCAHGLNALDALLSAIETATSSGLGGCVPVASYIEATKQLISLGRFKDALPISLTAAKIYPTSAVTLLMVGIINLRLGEINDAEVAFRESIYLIIETARFGLTKHLCACRAGRVEVRRQIQLYFRLLD